MKNKKIAVLSGGISPEREVSLVSGKYVLEALQKNFEAEGFRLDENKVPNLDPSDWIVYPAMHGDYGEDGTLQNELDKLGIEYAGSGSLSSRVCMVKPAAKALLKFAGLPVAKSVEFNADNHIPSAKTLSEFFPTGVVVKPADKGSSVGLVAAKNIDELNAGLKSIRHGQWMAEEFVKGREFSIGVIYGKAAGIVEIIPEGGIYDYKRKYTAGSTRYEFPAKIGDSTADAMRNAAEKAFAVCGCRDFARVDFIMSDESTSKFVILELNTLPGMTPTSLLPKSASCIGLDFPSLCARLVEGAISRTK